MAQHGLARSSTEARAIRRALLLVDDDPLVVESLALVLEDDFEVHTASTRQEAKSLLRRLDRIPPLALVDLGLPPMPHEPVEGYALISELLAFDPAMKVLVLSGQSTRDTIQHALTLGAVDFVSKPTDAGLLRARLAHHALMHDLEEAAFASRPGSALVGESSSMLALRASIGQFADAPFAVLIEGESGVGKELVAERLHTESRRASQPFLSVNCAAFSPELLEVQLFGQAKGAFTGAVGSRAGLFEEAGRGSLFLDEVGELQPALQSKLLRVLENGEYYRLGETQPRRSQARVIAATNRDLREGVRRGVFRQDLYYRLSVLTIRVPPLRERGDDWQLFLAEFQRLYAGSMAPFTLTEAALKRLRSYDFPGNVRELRNIVIRLAAKYPGREVEAKMLDPELDLGTVAAPEEQLDLDQAAERQVRTAGFDLEQVLDRWERRYIDAALRASGGNMTRAARLLGVNRTTLYSRIERLKGLKG